MFIKVHVKPEDISDQVLVKKLVEICPVDIFSDNQGVLSVVEENQDECTLCNLCIEATPEGMIRIIRLYEEQ
tara:strand:+ start:324 stop:539 length:216 start_codon:yes stop_codon:yes gene_type:complete